MASFVFDRTEQDLINETDKAFINFTDLNRIESAAQELNDAIVNYAYRLNEMLTHKINWAKQTTLGVVSLDNIPTTEQLTRILSNITKLKAAYFTYDDTPELPLTLDYATIQTFNSLEKNLHDMHLIVTEMRDDFRECGTFGCGGATFV